MKHKDQIIEGVQPTNKEIEDLWNSKRSTTSNRALKKMGDKAKDKKPTLKQLELM